MAGECDKNVVSELNPEMFKWAEKSPRKSPLIITKLAFHLIRRGYPLGLQMLLPLGQGTILLIRKHRADRRWYFPKRNNRCLHKQFHLSQRCVAAHCLIRNSQRFLWGSKTYAKAFETTFAPNSPALIRVSIWSALWLFSYHFSTNQDGIDPGIAT